MKKKIAVYSLAFGILLLFSCNRKMAVNTTDAGDMVYKGVLVKSGICSQKVVEVLGDAEGLNFEESWTDESTGKSYKNVFSINYYEKKDSGLFPCVRNFTPVFLQQENGC